MKKKLLIMYLLGFLLSATFYYFWFFSSEIKINLNLKRIKRYDDNYEKLDKEELYYGQNCLKIILGVTDFEIPRNSIAWRFFKELAAEKKVKNPFLKIIAHGNKIFLRKLSLTQGIPINFSPSTRGILALYHTLIFKSIDIPSYRGFFESIKFSRQRFFLLEETEKIPLKIVFMERKSDLIFFQPPSEIWWEANRFLFPIGNSQDLKIGNAVVVFSNVSLLNFVPRQGTVISTEGFSRPPEVERIGIPQFSKDSPLGNPETHFIIQSPIVPGDSGAPVMAIRDGNLELVGLIQGVYHFLNENYPLGIVLRIDFIKKRINYQINKLTN